MCIADAVQCSSINALAGWHSDERSVGRSSSSPAHLQTFSCGCHINVHVIVILIMIDQRKNLHILPVKCVLEIS